VLHLIRNTFRFAARQHWDAMARQLRPVYTAVNEADARARLEEFYEDRAGRYPAIRSLWANAWVEFVPFLDYSVEIRRSSTRPMPSRASTLGCAERPELGATSRRSRPR